MPLHALLAYTDLAEIDKEAAWRLLMVISLKFVSIWSHYIRYASMEHQLIAEGSRHPIDLSKDDRVHVAMAQGMYMELDGFLVQVKSALDHVTTFLHYAFGLSRGGLSTFGNNGNGVIKKLQNNISRSPPCARRLADILVSFIYDNQGWLKATIELRDRMNHYLGDGVSAKAFVVATVKELDGTHTLLVPMMSEDKSIRYFMEHVWRNTLGFAEFFVGICLSAKITSMGTMYVPNDDPKAQRWMVIAAENLPKGEDGKPLARASLNL
jgi:hypothetical protein